MRQKIYFKIYNPEHPNHGSSSTVHKVQYDDKTNTLYVNFHNGNKYEYLDVPNHVADEAFNADSVGKYLIANVFKKYSDNKI